MKNSTYVTFAQECITRAGTWLDKYNGQYPMDRWKHKANYTLLELDRQRRERLRKLELSIKNLDAAIAEIEVEMAYVNKELEDR
jgi:hypothetical protein